MDALLVVDVQNDFMPFGSLPVADGDAVVGVANRLMPRFGLVVATQDWHPADHGSFASNHPGASVGDVVDLDGVAQVLWPDHCVQGTPGASFHSALDVTRIESGRKERVLAEADAVEGARSAIEAFTPMAAEKGIARSRSPTGAPRSTTPRRTATITRSTPGSAVSASQGGECSATTASPSAARRSIPRARHW